MIFNYATINEFLADELRRRVRANPRYSLRAFAKNLQLSPGALSEILRGRRDLSLRSIPDVAKAIGLNAAEGKHLLHLAQKSKAKNLREFESERPEQHLVSEDIFALISDWYHFAILNLLECDDFEWNARWISSRLAISRIQAQMAMDLLLRTGLVIKKKDRYAGAREQVVSPSEIPSAAVRSYHRQILEKAVHALEAQTLKERDFSGCGFALDIAFLPAIKKELAEFHDRLLAKYGKGRKTEVYFLETALFKLTQGESK